MTLHSVHLLNKKNNPDDLANIQILGTIHHGLVCEPECGASTDLARLKVQSNYVSVKRGGNFLLTDFFWI